MAAYQFLNPAPVLFTINGIEPVAGGTLSFFDEGTTNPRDTWSDPDLVSPGHLNSNPVPLDAAGRSESAIWLDGDYTVVLRDSVGDEVWTRVVRSDVTSALAIPALAPGFLTNDLSNLLWQDILLIPDPTGSPNYILSTDGANLLWIPQPVTPTPPDPEIIVTDSTVKSFQAGTSDVETKYFVQCGTGSAPASGSENTTDSVVFPTAFTTLWHVSVTQTHNGVTPFGAVPSQTNTAQSTSGFSVRFSTEENSTASGWNITSPVPYSWMAVGTITVPAA